MAGNTVSLTFAGDATQLQRAAQQSTQALDQVNDAVTESGAALSAAAQESTDFGTKLGHLGGAVSGATDALDSIGGSLTAVNDLMQAGANRAAAQRRALLAVEQAQEDYNQSLRDGAQAQIDIEGAGINLERANLDAAVALRDYNAAVKEFGVNSDEAKFAALDLKDANLAIKQANEDGNQATRDLAQSTIDAKTAQEDLNDANKEAHPPELQKWADNLALLTPLLTAVIGVVGLITAAQWAWNAAQLASPTTWIIIGIVALIAVIALIALKTTWFQDIWKATWGAITDAATWAWDKLKAGASAVWDHLKKVWEGFKALPEQLRDMFSKVTGYITAPFRAAFNYVSDAWNNTIGRLSWTVPGWVPGVGGNSISAPKLPKYHQGGIVSGALGAETLAVLQAGERVTPAGGGGGGMTLTIESGGSRLDDLLVEILQRALARRGGNVQRILGSTRG